MASMGKCKSHNMLSSLVRLQILLTHRNGTTYLKINYVVAVSLRFCSHNGQTNFKAFFRKMAVVMSNLVQSLRY